MIRKNYVLLYFFLFLLVSLFFTAGESFTQTQSQYRDPFETRFPQTPKEEAEEIIERPVDVPLPALTVTGVLYSRRGVSRAIVNGKVYKTGDVVAGTQVEIHEIKKDKIFVLFQGSVFDVNIVKKDFKKRREDERN